jgi:hypothetical protein
LFGGNFLALLNSFTGKLTSIHLGRTDHNGRTRIRKNKSENKRTIEKKNIGTYHQIQVILLCVMESKWPNQMVQNQSTFIMIGIDEKNKSVAKKYIMIK